jgi:addiction module antitoxin, relB/dinJ family
VYNIGAIDQKGVDLMATTTNFSVRMDSDIKKECEALYGELGINLTTAINVFLRQSLRAGGFPFDVRLEQPNKETIVALLEAERISRDPSVKRYSDVEEALKELKA